MAEEKRISLAILIPVGLSLVLAAAVGVYALARAAPLAPPPPPPGRANLYGRVTDTAGKAISGVLISLNGMQVFTDAQGNYAFADLEPGSYRLEFSKEGYETAVF